MIGTTLVAGPRQVEPLTSDGGSSYVVCGPTAFRRRYIDGTDPERGESPATPPPERF